MKTVIIYFIIAYFVFISVASVILTVYDKYAAIKGKRRTPENTLMLFSALGGSVIMLAAMLIIRHKTKHIKFMLGIPIIILFQLMVVLWIICRYV